MTMYFKPTITKETIYEAKVSIMPIKTSIDSPTAYTGLSFMKKRYWLKDEFGFSKYFDSPATINEKCPIQSTFFKLYHSDSKKDNKLSKDFTLSTTYWCLVYVIEDKQNSDNEGNVLIWRYNKTMQTIIERNKTDFNSIINISFKYDGIYQSYKESSVIKENTTHLKSIYNESLYTKELINEIHKYKYLPWTEKEKEQVKFVLSKYIKN